MDRAEGHKSGFEAGEGALLIRRNPRARRLILRIDPATGRPVLTVPPGASKGEVDRFLAAHQDWIRRRLAVLPERLRLEPGNRFPFRGRQLHIRHDADAPRRPAVEGDCLLLGGPPAHVEARLIRWLKERAYADLTARSRDFAQRLGVTIEAVTVRDTTSRWGSCSPSGRLSFTWRLILAPEEVAAYVAAHEVAHRCEMNHSPRFWRLVGELVGDARSPRAWLKTHGPALFAIGPPQTASLPASG